MPSPIMQFFAYAQLPPELQGISAAVANVAEGMDLSLPDGAEKSAGLRKLLEAKDCFVRAALGQPVEVELPSKIVLAELGGVEGRLDGLEARVAGLADGAGAAVDEIRAALQAMGEQVDRLTTAAAATPADAKPLG